MARNPLPTASPYQSPHGDVVVPSHSEPELPKASRFVCIIGFWVSICHILLLVAGLLFVPHDDARSIWRADSWPLLIALIVWEHPLTSRSLALVADLIAAFGFHAGRSGRSPWLPLGMYTAVRLFGAAIAFAAAAYLVNLQAVTLPNVRDFHGGWVTSFYDADTFTLTAGRQAMLSIPLVFVLLVVVTYRLARQKHATEPQGG